MGVIYKITNLINNKIYIGQTVATEPQRWQSHVWHAYNDPSKDCVCLCNAIKKYGKENFKREILEEVDNEEELNNREIYYISLFNSNNYLIGYNITEGGSGHQKYNSDQILKLYEQYHSVIKVAKILGASRETISKRLRGMGIKTYDNTINQYSLNGELINTFLSFTEVKKITNLPLPKIVPIHHFSCNYIWVYEKDNLNISQLITDYKQNNYLTKEIYQYDLECNLINTFKSAAEASRILKINISSIKAAINGSQLTAGGYIWHKNNSNIKTLEEKYVDFLLSSRCCEIEEIDLSGQIIKKYPSSAKAEKELGWSYNSIKKVCDGITTHTHGRIFRYSNKDKRRLLNERAG